MTEPSVRPISTLRRRSFLWTAALAAAGPIVSEASLAWAARASFLRGLIADETGNTAELDTALAHLAQPVSADQQGDADELLARRDLRQGAFDAAIQHDFQSGIFLLHPRHQVIIQRRHVAIFLWA